jgi:hypothetical protein
MMDRAEEERNHKITSADAHTREEIARGLTTSIMSHKSFAASMASIGDTIVSGMIQNAMMSIMANDMTKPSDAAAGAGKAWVAGSHFPFPMSIVIPPVLSALAFASVMAFEGGGIVPGVGRGDVVPAMLKPGEGVLPKKLMDGLKHAPTDGAGKGAVDVHHSPTYHLNMIDGTGVGEMLQEHGQKFTDHVGNELRKRNM